MQIFVITKLDWTHHASSDDFLKALGWNFNVFAIRVPPSSADMRIGTVFRYSIGIDIFFIKKNSRLELMHLVPGTSADRFDYFLCFYSTHWLKSTPF